MPVPRWRYLLGSLAHALRGGLLSGAGRRRRYLRAIARQPIEAAAAEFLAGLPAVSLDELVDLSALPPIDARAAWAGRAGWSIGIAERMALECLVRGRGARTVFEIGTFNGGTTAVLAAAVPADGSVVTMDLPPDRFAATQSPADLDATRIGEIWRRSADAHKVRQLAEDSALFDPAPFAAQFDLVLVDGAHDYEHGLVDTRSALRLVRPDGLIVFDDFTAYWAGLVRGIAESAAGHRLVRLDRTNLGLILPGPPS